MKKILYILIICLVLLIPSKVFAFSGNISLECDSFTKKVNENISCTLYGNTDSAVSAVESTLVYNDILLSNEIVSSIWQGDYQNKSLLLYTDINKTNKFEIMRFNVTSSNPGDYQLTFENTYFSDSSFVRNLILNPSYIFTFLTEEKTEEENKQIEVVEIPDSNDANTPNNDSSNDEKIEEENPGTGSFISISLIIVLSTISVLTCYKAKNKKIYKI